VVVPAQAGVVRSPMVTSTTPTRRPRGGGGDPYVKLGHVQVAESRLRARGGGPICVLVTLHVPASPPRVRGWFVVVDRVVGVVVSSPRPRGVVPRTGTRPKSAPNRPPRGGSSTECRPCARGGSTERTGQRDRQLVVPRTRGGPFDRQVQRCRVLIVPTPGGGTRHPTMNSTQNWLSPRTWGWSAVRSYSAVNDMSSPSTRE
jgi:hypothetical protein